MKIALKRLAMGIASAGLLTIYGCGGGSGDAAPTQQSMTLTPSLGQFSKGTIVRLKKLDDSVLSSGSIEDNGKVTLTFLDYTGPVVVEVLGGAGVTYYDEGTKTDQPYAGTLRAVVPAPQAEVGVTALTHAAAAKMGAISALTAAQINLANTKVAAIFGYADGSSILQAPKLVNISTGNALDVAITGDKYALILAALAKTAASGLTKAEVVEALASDLMDDKLNGLAGTTVISSYLPLTMTDQYQAAANDLANPDSKAFIALAPPFVPRTDVSTVVTASNQSDVGLAKAMFAELRTTLNSFSNGTTGFLDTQAVRMNADLSANVVPNMERVAARVAAFFAADEAFRSGQFTQGTNLETYASGQVQIKGSIDQAMKGLGSVGYCNAPTTTSSITSIACAFARPGNAINNFNNTGTLRMMVLTLTATSSSTSGAAYSYTAVRKNLPVSRSTTGTWSPAGALVAASVPTGGGTFAIQSDAQSLSLLTLNGTLPPSASSATNTLVTGVDTVAISAVRTALTSASNYRYALSGSVSTSKLAPSPGTGVDPTKVVTLSLDSGSYFDLDESAAMTGPKLLAVKMIGTAKTLATQFTGSIEAGSFASSVDGEIAPTSVVFNGSISDTSSGGAGQILTGKLEATVTNYQLYNSTQLESSTNFVKAKLTFTGTVQAPSRPLLKLVLAADRTNLNSGTVTLNYSYGANISITGSGIIDEANSANNTMTLSNQADIQVDTKTGLVTKAGVRVGTILNGSISYADGVTESLM